MQLDQEWDDVEVDEGGIDPNDFSHYLETDEVLRGFAMIALKRGYEMIDAGEDQGVVADLSWLHVLYRRFPVSGTDPGCHGEGPC